MWNNINLERCFAYVHSHAASEGKRGPPLRPAITISRETGAGGRTVASKLVDYLKDYTPVGCQWTVFDRKLIEKVLEDHNLSKSMAEFVPENRKSALTDTLEEFLGLHPPMETLVKHTAETVWNLAVTGYVILVGRGAHVVTQKLDNVFHVRLVGTLERRIERVQEVYELSRAQAREFVQKQETGKWNYLKAYFRKDINDLLLYDLIINTDRISYENAARLIAKAVIERYQLEPCGKATTA